jgi:hypothetical protein
MWLVQSCCRRRLGNKLMDPYRCAVESCETDLKLCFIGNLISRLDSGLCIIFRHDLLRCAEFALLEIMGPLASRT